MSTLVTVDTLMFLSWVALMIIALWGIGVWRD